MISKKDAITFPTGSSLIGAGGYLWPRWVSGGLPNTVVYPIQPDPVYKLVLDTAICAIDGDLLILIPSQLDERYTYEWNTANTDSISAIEDGGLYWVKYDDGCYFYVDSFRVAYTKLNPLITVNDEFELSTTTAYATYQWFLDGVLIPGATNRNYKINKNGDYTVEVSGGNCSQVSPVYRVTNVFISEQNVESLIRIYPNPANDKVYVDAPISVQIQIFDIEGRLLKQTVNAKFLSIIDLSPGIYLLKIFDQEGRVLKAEKLLK